MCKLVPVVGRPLLLELPKQTPIFLHPGDDISETGIEVSNGHVDVKLLGQVAVALIGIIGSVGEDVGGERCQIYPLLGKRSVPVLVQKLQILV